MKHSILVASTSFNAMSPMDMSINHFGSSFSRDGAQRTGKKTHELMGFDVVETGIVIAETGQQLLD